jgi:hypothetical protein
MLDPSTKNVSYFYGHNAKIVVSFIDKASNSIVSVDATGKVIYRDLLEASAVKA